MSGRYGRFCAALGGLVLASAACAQQQPKTAANQCQFAASAKADSQHGLTVSEAHGLMISCEANRIATVSAHATVQQARYAGWQVILGGTAAALTGVAALAAIAAAYYAKKAADHTEKAAKTAAEALNDSRASNTEQATRFEQQLEVANQSVDAASAAAIAFSQAARWTRSAANAAHRQVALSERSMNVMERPYVFFHDTQKLESPGFGLASPPPNTFRIIWKNFGKTPALVTRVRLGLSHEDEGADPTTMPKHEMPFGAVIGVNDEWRRGQVVVTDAMIRDFAEDARPIWICGDITYNDLHGVEHRTWFCRFFVGAGFVLDDSCDAAFNGYS